MSKLEILLIVAVIESADLSRFELEDLSEFWAALTVCRDDECFFVTFSAAEQEQIKAALKKVETELIHRHKEPVNFFQLMQSNPARVEFYLKSFSVNELLGLEADLSEFAKSAIVADFLKLVRKQIYRQVAVS